MAKIPSEVESERIISGMKWMGILSSEKATVAGGNLLDTLCAQLERLMSFKPGERDLVMLQHKFVVEWNDQKTVWLCFCLTYRAYDTFGNGSFMLTSYPYHAPDLSWMMQLLADESY